MTIDELITKIDNEPKEAPAAQTETQVVDTPPETNKEEDMLPIGKDFEEYCEQRKRK